MLLIFSAQDNLGAKLDFAIPKSISLLESIRKPQNSSFFPLCYFPLSIRVKSHLDTCFQDKELIRVLSIDTSLSCI